ncbi:RNA-directed DNA polymerase, eukaryota, reverse transcriptase zinc-binding domain protein [Tanacetum coccineum]|uniref:RNA-directed DNA polymerase, eukaryota, reverse transcriptase zinc-binding domain protein n=1 Tax=Tanacetum coccineum TaxID=301880 RepID=A0ABQ4XV17_9ASTR
MCRELLMTASSRLVLDSNFPCKLDIDQQVDLENNVSSEEINRAVWDCEHGTFPKGGNSSFITLIPKTTDAKLVKEFRPITLIGSVYKIIAKILENRLVTVLVDIVNEVQSVFVANRKILDGPFMLNEVFQWCKKKRKQSMIFKVDFEKAYDSVRWDYLDDVLKIFGFGDRWRGWIQNCLTSSRGSVIVNGSPTREFQFHRGLKQGDPLSPFLFILIMESLHISVQRVVDVGLFRGISIGPSLHLSHLFYADDAVFLGHWSNSNIDTIVRVLDCFYRASGLRINMTKSKIIGISMSSDIVDQAASKIRCASLKPSFSYLGSKVGGLMSRIQSWDEIMDKLAARLSKWKMKTLSIGGRLTLLKSVLGSMPIYHLSLFKAPSKVIKGIHSEDGKLDIHVNNYHPSIWLDVVREVNKLKNIGNDLLSSIHKKLGNGSGTLLWEDVWRGETNLKSLYPILFALESSVTLGDMRDRWVWSMDDTGEYSVASVKKVIDDRLLSDISSKTKWVNMVPIKINIHAWKVRLDGLPTRLNLFNREMDIESFSCPLYDNAVKSSSHIFFACHIAREVFRKITRWWDINFLEVSSHEEWTDWLSNLHLLSKHKKRLEGVCYVMWWHIWNFRNKSVFGASIPSKAAIFEDIVVLLFIGVNLDVRLLLVG